MVYYECFANWILLGPEVLASMWDLSFFRCFWASCWWNDIQWLFSQNVTKKSLMNSEVFWHLYANRSWASWCIKLYGSFLELTSVEDAVVDVVVDQAKSSSSSSWLAWATSCFANSIDSELCDLDLDLTFEGSEELPVGLRSPMVEIQSGLSWVTVWIWLRDGRVWTGLLGWIL